MVDKLKEAALKKFEVYAKGVERLKELEKELNSLSTKKYKKQELKIRKKLRNVSLIPEIEEDIRKLRLKIAGIDQEDLDSNIDKKQQLEINNINVEEKEIESEVSSLHNKINSLELELKKAESLQGKKIVDKDDKKLLAQIPINRKKINFLKNLLVLRTQQIEEEISRKKFYNRSKIVSEIKDIDAINQKQDNKINFLKKESQDLQQIIPAVIERIASVEEEITIAEQLSKKKELTDGEKKNIQRLPILKHNLSLLRSQANNLKHSLAELEFHQLSDDERADVDKIPGLRRKTNFLSRLFKKESAELAELENRVDKDKLDMNDKLLNEIAESKRLIQEEKLELKKHLMDLLEKSLKEVNKQKEESDKKLLEQIQLLNQKIDADKKNMDQEVIAQIIELREKLNKDKNEVEKNNKQIADIKKQLTDFSMSEEKMIPELVFKKIAIPEKKLSKQELAKQEKMTAAIQTSFSLPKPTGIPQLEFANAPDFPRFEKPLEFAIPETKIKPGKAEKIMTEKNKIEKPKKLRIPKKRFMHAEDYEIIDREFKQLKYLVTRDCAYLSKNISSKTQVEDHLLKMGEKFGKIKQNFSKIKPTFSFKTS